MSDLKQYFEDFTRDESALEAIAGLIGDVATERFHEKKKSTPDMEKLAQLEARMRELYEKRQKIYSGDKELKEQCIQEFSERCRKVYGTPFFDKPEQNSGAVAKVKAVKPVKDPIKCPQKTH